MATRQILIYATGSDLTSLLERVEDKLSLQYLLGGQFEHPPTAVYSACDLKNLGIARDGDMNLNVRYLVTDIERCVTPREIGKETSRRLYVVDQAINPETVVLEPGGIFDTKCLIQGRLATAYYENPRSQMLFRQFGTEVRKQFRKLHSSYLGTEAASLLAQGWRLTFNFWAPPEFDLQVPLR